MCVSPSWHDGPAESYDKHLLVEAQAIQASLYLNQSVMEAQRIRDGVKAMHDGDKA